MIIRVHLYTIDLFFNIAIKQINFYVNVTIPNASNVV